MSCLVLKCCVDRTIRSSALEVWSASVYPCVAIVAPMVGGLLKSFDVRSRHNPSHGCGLSIHANRPFRGLGVVEEVSKIQSPWKGKERSDISVV